MSVDMELEKGGVEEPTKPDCMKRSEKFFSDSTFNGALYIFARKSWLKRVLWGMVVLVAIAGFWAVTIVEILRLTREPISTSILLTREDKLNFPAVTICSLSLLNTTDLDSAGASVVDDLDTLFALSRDSDFPGCRTVANKLISDTGQNLNWGDLTFTAKYDLSAIIESCEFVGQDCMDDFELVRTVAGVCYTFNGPSTQRPRSVNGTGIRQGLRLQLSQNNQHFSLRDDYGFRVVIHNPDELPIPESEGIAVGLNSSVYIGMRQVNSRDATIYSSGHQCRGDDYNTNQKLSFPDYPSYSPSACQSECSYVHLANLCGCTESGFYTPVSSPYDQLEPCDSLDLCCVVQAFDAVGESCDCPPKCETIARTVTVSSSTHNEGLVGVNVYYESLILETRETTDSYTPWDLISNIGGNTGLFLGFTLLSGVELLILVVGLVKDCCCGGCKRPGEKQQKSNYFKSCIKQ